jgi:hypothetical protein
LREMRLAALVRVHLQLASLSGGQASIADRQSRGASEPRQLAFPGACPRKKGLEGRGISANGWTAAGASAGEVVVVCQTVVRVAGKRGAWWGNADGEVGTAQRMIESPTPPPFPPPPQSCFRWRLTVLGFTPVCAKSLVPVVEQGFICTALY